MLERRKNPGTLTLKTGKLSISDRMPPIECAILDITDTGACVLVPNGAEIPSTFSLVIDGAQDRYYCHVKWKSRARLGVEFQTKRIARAGAGAEEQATFQNTSYGSSDDAIGDPEAGQPCGNCHDEV